MQYDSFYFLHIPKTDGRRFIDYILLDLKDSNPQLKFPAGNLMGNYFGDASNAHQGWITEITDNTYVFSMIRDPIERAVSYYVFLILSHMRKNKNFDNYKKINFTKEAFIKYVETEKSIRNTNSKMFLYDMNSNLEKRFFYENDISLNNKDLFSLLIKNLERTNLLLKSDTFNSIDKQDLMRKICQDLELNDLPILFKKLEFSMHYTEKQSSILYNLLTDSDKDYLRKYYDLDYYMYERGDLFWNP